MSRKLLLVALASASVATLVNPISSRAASTLPDTGLFAPVEPLDEWERADADIRDLRELPEAIQLLK